MNVVIWRFSMDVVRSIDGGVPKSGVRSVETAFSLQKALEMKAMSDMKRGTSRLSRYEQPKADFSMTLDLPQWLDTQGRPMPMHFMFDVGATDENGNRQKQCLIHLDKAGGFHLWNLMPGTELVRTKAVSIDWLIASLRGDDVEAIEGIRRLPTQTQFALESMNTHVSSNVGYARNARSLKRESKKAA